MRTQVYTQSFGLVWFDNGSNLYNGYMIEEIEAMNFAGWSEHDKTRYINNYREVIDCQVSGINAGYCDALKNSNFEIVRNNLKKTV